MLYGLLSKVLADRIIILIASIAAFIVTYILMARPPEFLPRDGGKFVFTPDGKKIEVNKGSSGKVTGVGLIFVCIYLFISFLFLPVSLEFVLYLILSAIMMITGYLDDTSKAPWGELIKGILDFVLALAATIVFIKFNGTDVVLLKMHFHIPVVLYAILAVALIWASINVTNCTDGVDGLCGSISVVELFAFSAIFGLDLGKYSGLALVLAFVLAAYLGFNWNPSSVLMGDAGSRTIGFTLALLAMESRHPFAFLLLSSVFIFDGGMGLFKLAFIRVTKKKDFLSKIRFPFHDHLRKNMGWQIPKIVIMFVIIEIVMVVITGVIVNLCR
ncbi:MAG: phospho-N-acetylmuramoyl-pentapeptide-transferase [Eubacterium sp.]|nr:phospho-N-acetylmuramoyl-pentapeptide-transferase [Eubacterium sp.]